MEVFVPEGDVYINSIDAGGGDDFQGLVELHIGGGETDGAAQAVAGDDYPVKAVRAAQHRSGILHPAFRQGIADTGRTDGTRIRIPTLKAPGFDYTHTDHVQSFFAGNVRQFVSVMAIASHPVVVAQYQAFRPETPDEHLTDILAHRQTAEGAGKFQDFHPVYAHFHQQRLFLLHRTQQTEIPGLVLQDIAGMGPKSDDEALRSTPVSLTNQSVNQKTVPQMDAVKESGGYNHLTSSKS